MRAGTEQSPDLVGITLRPQSVLRSPVIYVKHFHLLYLFFFFFLNYQMRTNAWINQQSVSMK